MDTNDESSACALCKRLTSVAHLTKHHLRPKSRGGRETVLLCRMCHGQVHATFDNRELEAEYDTITKLRACPDLAAYLEWVAKRPATQVFARRRAGRRKARP